MSALDAAGADAAAPDPPRPDVLAYPAPTTSRFLVFVAALLSAGAFVGGWLHNQVLGDDWTRTVARCEQQALDPMPPPGPGSPAARSRAREESCQASVERRRAAFILGGAAAAGVAALLVMFLTPRVLERRRGLHALGPRLAGAGERLRVLAEDARLAHPPVAVLGSTRLRDAFSYGTPGHYRIALPPAVAVRWRDQSLFDPVVRHELAHVRHRDVTLAWLSRSVWYAIAPVLAVPVIVAIASGDLSLLPDYVWRVVLLAAAVQLVSSALLRSREHDADLRAAQAAGGPEAVAGVVALTADAPKGGWYRRVMAKHPTRASRLAVLHRPQEAVPVRFVDGFTAAFLAALSIPLVVSALTAMLTGSGHTTASLVIAAWVAGPLLAGSVGLGFCRAALVNRLVGAPTRVLPAALGVAAGLVLGQAASLAQTGIGTRAFGPVAWQAASAVLGAGAVALAAGLAELFAAAAPRFRSARASWSMALVVMSVLFTAVLWICTTLQTLVSAGSVATREWLVTGLASWLVLAALGVTAAAAGWALLVGGLRAPPWWLLERGTAASGPAHRRQDVVEVLGTGVVTGLVFAAALAAFRAVSGPAASAAEIEERLYLIVWVAAAAAATAALGVAVLRPRGSLGTGLVAGTLACATTVVGWLALNTALGGSLSPSFVATIAKPPLALGLVLIVLVAPAALLPVPTIGPARWSWPALAGLSAVLAAAVVTERGTLYPVSAVAGTVDQPGAGALSASTERIGELIYITHEAPRLARTFEATNQAASAILTARGADARTQAGRIEREILTPLRARLEEALAYRASSTRVGALHREAVAALRGTITLYASYASAYRGAGPAAYRRARAAQRVEERHFGAWLSGVVELRRSP